jgi:hypothetical protein
MPAWIGVGHLATDNLSHFHYIRKSLASFESRHKAFHILFALAVQLFE